MTQALPQAQLSALERRAAQSGVWRHLLIHLAILREESAFAEAARYAEGEDALWRDVLLLERNPGFLSGIRDRLNPDTDIGVVHGVMRFLLARRDFEGALALVELGLKRREPDIVPMNLMAKTLYALGEVQTARSLLETSLQFNPGQGDLAAWQDRTADQIVPPLDVVPCRKPLTFYLPVYNVEAHITTAIEGLLLQSYPLEEILVVDDGSEDQSAALARQYPVRLVSHGMNRGLAAARNTAFQCAGSAFLGAIDTDAVPEADFAYRAMMAFEHAAPQVAGIGGRMFEANTATPADRWRAAHLGQDCGPQRRCPTGLFGACTIHRRRDITEAGGFDEKCRTNAEDWYIVRALEARGKCLEYTPHAVAWHQRTDTEESVLDTMWRWAFWMRHDRGDFAADNILDQGLTRTLDQARYCFQHDVGSGARDLIGLDLAYAFRGALLDLRHGLETGALTRGRAIFVQRRVLACCSAAPHFAGFIERVTAPLLLPGDGEDGPVISPFFAGLEQFAACCASEAPG